MLRRNTPADHKYMPEVTKSDRTVLGDVATIVGKNAPDFNPDG
jgi:hypothetical protein